MSHKTIILRGEDVDVETFLRENTVHVRDIPFVTPILALVQIIFVIIAAIGLLLGGVALWITTGPIIAIIVGTVIALVAVALMRVGVVFSRRRNSVPQGDTSATE